MSLFAALTNSENIPSQFPRMPHPLKPKDQNGDQPIETNKFYANMLLDDRNLYTYPFPYSVWWTGNDVDGFCGLAVSHEDASSRVFGPDINSSPCEFFFSPTGVMSVCLGAHWGGAPSFSTNSWGPMSVNAVLSYNSTHAQFPIASGMGFVTGIYTGVAPIVSSQVGFRSVTTAVIVRAGITRVNALLENNTTWSIYVSSPRGSSVTISQTDSQHITVNSTESGLVVQVAKLGDTSWQAVIDSAAGAYPTQVSLSGGVTSDYKVATYRLNYNLAGSSTGGGTLLYAAPHHVASFTSTMNGRVTGYYLNSPTMGMLRLCVATLFEMYEQLPKDIGFLPWYQGKPVGDSYFSYSNFSGADIDLLVSAAEAETNYVDISSATNLSSMYFSGKVMSKYANILLVVTYIARHTSLAQKLLSKMKDAMNTFIQNKQQTPLFYDIDWKGLVSQAGIQDPMADFGNTYYNDHHFHYGYFIHSAAIVAKVDQDIAGGSWVKNTTNKDWVQSLIRDIATFGDDLTYPQSRMFDWYSGHGLAKGLFVSADGKDEESSSEDYNAFYGIKLWGEVTGNQSLTARANLILAIESRSMNDYMLYLDSNTIMPSKIIGNKVSGILFENKIDHTTYFGALLQYIQGIHMVPITPISSLIRSPTFVEQEWKQLLAAIINNVDDGWKGILMINLALTDPSASYQFFSNSSFQDKWLDNGLSRTWGLAFAKALM